jgi:hypothetical protein
MKSFPGWTLSTFLKATPALIAAALTLSPADARASCGDYLHTAKPARIGTLASQALPDVPPNQHPPVGPCRCSGPGCGSHVPLTPAPVPSAPPGIDLWAQFMPVPEAEPPAAAGTLAAGPNPRALRRGSNVYHPPR